MGLTDKPFLICRYGKQLVAAPDCPQDDTPQVVEPISPADVLRELLGHSETIADILILTTDKKGVGGLIGTLDGPAESLLFMKRFENNIVNAGVEPINPGPRIA